ncbi:phosphoribosyl-AMP cyclohydrolase [Rhodovulum sulfidophilum]|uniref:phosphoribosyl-AMP cyclohydrolase n=1 Tax=Rhodovulum sulfidophilum TaxID=35806 RepID=UPI001F29621E|nr:phosphoribosyl-AMP cyclohydrolase [Rhodovulum sulfidophilum]MCE8455330.1 phosphoribosyl-AMP cyclohydrolase [Rhodovulum sulfidophilum]
MNTQKAPEIKITEEEIAQALVTWGNGKIAISRAFEEGGIEAARQVALTNLDAYYGYTLGPVLFKPTMASGEQTFRPTKPGALAYFCGHSEEYPLDNGFAIMGWRACEHITSASFIQGDIAMWMGWIRLTNKDGSVTTVDKSFGYKKDETGTLRIVLHHSSLPYQPPEDGA